MTKLQSVTELPDKSGIDRYVPRWHRHLRLTSGNPLTVRSNASAFLLTSSHTKSWDVAEPDSALIE
ncbi:MAG: hypothetical protein F6K63_22175 [Moorea sp. SIO1G6]|nr:hypothetical protein [Moorena sp. SIO1G6]